MGIATILKRTYQRTYTNMKLTFILLTGSCFAQPLSERLESLKMAMELANIMCKEKVANVVDQETLADARACIQDVKSELGFV